MKSQFIRRNNNIYAQSFSVRHDYSPHFLKLWHHHQELELVLILQGSGTRFIGDSMEPFQAGDLVFLGDYLPHKWQSGPEYLEQKGLMSEAIIIHFERDFLANALTDTVEFGQVNELLKASNRGLSFPRYDYEQIESSMRKIMHGTPGLQRMILLLDLLRRLTECNHEPITSSGYVNSAYEKDQKLKQVNDYIMNNFQQDVSLNDVAAKVQMNASAFSRYFKKATSKTFNAYLNEVRIGYACKRLQDGNFKSIAEVCYESGFNNLSNFNDKFKKRVGYSPREYRLRIS